MYLKLFLLCFLSVQVFGRYASYQTFSPSLKKELKNNKILYNKFKVFLSQNLTKPDNRTDNRTKPAPKPDNRTDNKTDNKTHPDPQPPKPDNRTDNKTDNKTHPDPQPPKPDNRTDNKTDNKTHPDPQPPKPDNRTDNKTDNKTHPDPQPPKPDNRTDNKTDNKTIRPDLAAVNTHGVEYERKVDMELIFKNKDVDFRYIQKLIVNTKRSYNNSIDLLCYGNMNNYTIACKANFLKIKSGIYVAKALKYNNSFIDIYNAVTFYVQKMEY